MHRTILSLVLMVIVAGAAFGHTPITYFVPTVPDPTTMVQDGSDADWGWLNQADFALDEWNAIQGNSRLVDPNGDFNFLVFVAWSPPPDNAFYFFARSSDDTLRFGTGGGEAHSGWWNDDSLVVGFDMDHGAGLGIADEELGQTVEEGTLNGYRCIAHPLYSLDQGLHEPNSHQENYTLEQNDWACKPPNAFYGGTLSPPDAVEFQFQVEATYEYKIRLFDELTMPDYEDSIPHIFEEDQIAHIHIDYADGDWGAHGQSQFWGQNATSVEDCCSWTHDHNKQDDAVILMTLDSYDPATYPDSFGDGSTAVENTTWARIKSHIAE